MVGAAFHQSFPQAALTAQPAFQTQHPSVVGLVIVAQQVQQTVQSKDSHLDALRVSSSSRLPARYAPRYYDVTQETPVERSG
jgi:hypothetical protein